MIVNVHYAKTHLSKLIEQAEAGEDVVIARAGRPAVKLAPVSAAHRRLPPDEPRRPDGLPGWMGALKGEIRVEPDAEASDPALAQAFEAGEVFPPDDA